MAYVYCRCERVSSLRVYVENAHRPRLLRQVLGVRYLERKCVSWSDPTRNDSFDELRELSRWVYENLGKDTPLHFNRFYPHYKMKDLPPTPVKTLDKAHLIALEEGMRFVYVGNVPGHPHENTRLFLLIRRPSN